MKFILMSIYFFEHIAYQNRTYNGLISPINYSDLIMMNILVI